MSVELRNFNYIFIYLFIVEKAVVSKSSEKGQHNHQFKYNEIWFLHHNM